MNIHCILICYALDREVVQLFENIHRYNVTKWHLFLHSDLSGGRAAFWELTARYSNVVTSYAYGANRGLATSWNEGIEAAYMRGADVALIINDDMEASYDDVCAIGKAALDHPECGVIKCMGTDLRSGKRTPMEFGMTAITKTGWKTVGAFDENIRPIYWEDIDWDYRRKLLGVPEHIVDSTNVVHTGSKTSVTVPGMVEMANRWYNANQEYYIRKWGATHIAGEQYRTPFNDSTLTPYIDPLERRHIYQDKL